MGARFGRTAPGVVALVSVSPVVPPGPCDHRRTRRMVWTSGVVALVLGAGCGGEEAAGPATTGGDPTSTGSATQTTATETTAPETAPPTETSPMTETSTDTVAPPATFEVVRTTVVGAAVGGSAGAVGPDSTDPFSEAVRNEDGTCSGWSGPGGTWTQGLESGAPVVFLARESDEQIGSGSIGTSRWEDVGAGREQWNCVFPFEGEIEGEPDSFRIQVADLPPWVVARDPTDPSRWVVSIDTVARFDVFDECTSPDPSTDQVLEWQAVGVFWSRGIPPICQAGLVVTKIERPCRPAGFASEHIVAVTRADDPSVVLEDATGLRVDVAELAPLTEVVVHVATGRPCA